VSTAAAAAAAAQSTGIIAGRFKAAALATVTL